MNKNILIIGGSYFTGRVFFFSAIDEGYTVSLLNRGRFSMKGFGGKVTEYVCDRRDEQQLRKLSVDTHYDAIIDFCAYEPGDISRIMDNLHCSTKQYIYLSTSDVAKPSEQIRNEMSELQDVRPENEVGLYTWKKMLLEKELINVSEKHDCSYTILRPAFIFGPYNYAPRESWYVRNIVSGNAIPHPTDAKGSFSMVYVKDVARAILNCIGNEKAENEIYLLSAPDIMTYDTYLDLLKEASDRDVYTIPVTVSQVLVQNIPLPFPLTEAENEVFDGQKIVRDLGFYYEDCREAMQKTYNAFRDTFSVR